MKITGQELRELFGKNVKKNRKRIGLSLEKLAENLSVSRNSISNIERGTRFAKAETIAKLAAVFQIDVYELFKTEAVLPDKLEGLFFKYGEDVIEAVEKVKNDYIGKLKG